MKRYLMLALWLMPFATIAQFFEIQFDHLSHVKGLSNRSITSVVQDNQGFLWFGTQDGLLRYDGYQVVAYKSNLKDKHSLAENNIRALAKDQTGNIWIATQGGGVDKFDVATGRFVHFRHSETDANTISSNVVWSVFIDRANRVWIGTWANGLSMIDIASGKISRVGQEITDAVLAIAEDKAGNIWFGAKNLHKVSGRSIETYPLYNDGVAQVAGLRAVLPDINGKIWAGSDTDGIFEVDPFTKASEKVLLGQDPSTEKVYALHKHHDGSVWAGTDGGLVIFNEGNTTVLKHDGSDPYSLSNNAVRAIITDQNGSIWIGNEGGGINKPMASKKFHTFRHRDDDPGSIAHNIIRSLYDDSAGRIWVGTQGGGASVWDPADRKFYDVQRKFNIKLSSKSISAFLEDGDDFWIGTWGGGINRVNLSTGVVQEFHHEEGNAVSLPDDRIQVIYKDRAGILWVGTENGLCQFDYATQTFTPFGAYGLVKLLGSNIQGKAFLEQQDGTLWIGSWFGLHRLSADRKSITYYTSDTTEVHPLSNDHVISLHLDQKGNLWIGTFGGGLNKLHLASGTVTHYTEQEGLPNNAIFGIEEDNRGYLWMSTNNGLSRFNPATAVFRNYDVAEGLQSNEFYWGAAHRNRDGSLMFGGINGLNWFTPEEIEDNEVVPPVVLTDFQIFNKPVAIGGSSPLSKLINFTEHITLRYDQAVLNFQFAALNYEFPEKNQYAYLLEGFDDEWNYVNDRRTATYTNLNPGTYVFRVRASNNDYLWNEEGVALTIVVEPPFWRTWWFYLLVLAAGASVIYLFIKFRERKLQRDKRYVQETLEASLNEMKREVELQRQLVAEEQERNKERIWTDQSLAKFGKLLSLDNDNVERLCGEVLSALVKHLQITGGAIYVFDEDQQLLKRVSNFGLASAHDDFAPGEGLVGTCFETREAEVINNLPAGFVKVTSGLGEATPTHLVLLPIVHDKLSVGVLELASFAAVPTFHREFLTQLMERVATTINSIQLAHRTFQLLTESKVQAEELRQREEELKQNLEELQAMHEDRDRRTQELEMQIAALKNKLRFNAKVEK